MALSRETFTANGSNDTFSVNFPYISKSHVKVYLDGVETTAFTWPTNATIKLNSVPSSGVKVKLKRVTPSTPLVDYIDGTLFGAAELDQTALQSLYVSQEAQDDASEGILLGSDDIYNANNKRIKNVADPTAAQDAVTKAYGDANYGGTAAANAAASASAAAGSATDANNSKVAAATSEANAAASAATAQAAADGIRWKNQVKAATTANITLSAAQTIDGVAVVAGDRVLVKNQTAPAENGIYVVAADAWARAADLDTWGEIPSAAVSVEQGTVNAERTYICTADSGGTLGTTAVTFSLLGGGLIAANNLFTGAGNTFQGRLNTASAVGGTVDAITATHDPAFTAWVDKMRGTFRAAGANATTTPTFAPDGLAAKTFVKENLVALAVGDIAGAGHEVEWIYNSTADKVVILNPKGLGTPPRRALGGARTQNNTATSTTATIPHDDTIPQSGEGLELMTLSYTPTKATSTLRIRAVVQWSDSSTNDQVAIALFRDAGADALAVAMANSDQVGGYTKSVLDYETPANATSATTFRLRIGGQGATILINDSSQAQGNYGSTVHSFMEIQELSA